MPTQEPQQTSLETGAPLASNIDDWKTLLAAGVYPTTHCEMVEANGHVLIVKRMRDWGDKVSSGQRRIYRTLVRYGKPLDAPGSITVVVAWGMGQVTRRWQVFDHMGENDERQGTFEDYRAFLRSWHNEHRRS